MTDPLVTQVGVAAIVAVMILDRVFAFLKTRKNGGSTAGEQSTDYWRESHARTMTTAMDQMVVPLLRQQLELLKEMQIANSRHHDEQIKHTYMLEEIRNNLRVLDSSSQQTVHLVQQVLAGRMITP